jgi:hypothetical protein
MPGELVSAAAILATSGSGTWLADKLLGPSFEALGEQFKAFAGERLKSIFNRAGAKVDPAQVNELPPGFALQFVQKASFSEEDNKITEMWSNLLISASKDFNIRHSLFAEILSQLCAVDAKYIDSLARPDHPVLMKALDFSRMSMPVNIKSVLRRQIISIGKWPAENSDECHKLLQLIQDMDWIWPGQFVSISCPYIFDGNKIGFIDGGSKNSSPPNSLDVLERQGLVAPFGFEFGSPLASPLIEGVLVTGLGIQFVQTCRGVS